MVAAHFKMRTLLYLLLAIPLRASEPFVPENDSYVVEKLPRSLITLGHKIKTDETVSPLVRARNYLAIAQRTSDPAFVRYAEGVLAPWNSCPTCPIEVLFLRAVIKQHKHEFEDAMLALDQLLLADPAHAEAQLLKASILITQGRYDEARRIFAANLALTSTMRGLTIFSLASSLSGNLRSAEQVLLRAAAAGDGAETAFAWTTLAEMAVRAGSFEEATKRFERSLKVEPDNSYTVAAFADLLLAQSQIEKAIDLLNLETSSEALIARRYLARNQKPSPDLIEQLSRSGHFRELALLQIRSSESPDEALRSAEKNWATQKEPIDSILLLEAAIAAERPDRATMVLDWTKKTRLEDVRIAALVKRFAK
jgi:tetratricopeptide (TPR) repeat protein